MLCNVRDVLAPLHHWNYKFRLRRGGLIDAQTHTTRHAEEET